MKVGKLLAVLGGIAVGTGIGYLLFADKCKCDCCNCECDDDDEEFFDDLDENLDEESETSEREYIEIN